MNVVQSVGVLVLTALTVLLTVLAALIERSGPIRLRHWAEEAGGRLRALYERAVRFEAYRYLLSWLAKIAPVGLLLALWILLQRQGWHSATLWSLLVVAVILSVAEMLARGLVGRDPERALRRLTGVYRGAHFVLWPFIEAMAPLLRAPVLERREDEDRVTEDEIEAFINVGTQEGILDPGEEELIMGVIDFGDTVVRSVVTPRIDMVCAPVESDLEKMAELFLSSRHSRIPIYKGSVDQIVGVLHIRDLLRGLRSAEPVTLTDLAMPPYFVPETKPLNELLRELQAQRQQIAIVVDEYGGTEGVVTVEDLLEEIVGEIIDEHDEEAPVHESLPDGSWRIDGRESLELLDELFDTELEDEPFETVGGLIFGQLGSVPDAGEMVESHGLQLTVERVEGRSIRSVLVKKVVPVEEVGDA